MPDVAVPTLSDLKSLLPPLPRLRIRGRSVLPIVQGGMGVGISAHRLAGAVAACDAVGTVSSVDLRNHHPDLMERTRNLGIGQAARRHLDARSIRR